MTEPMDVDEALRMGEIALLAFEARTLRGPLREGACTDAASVVASLRARLRREREAIEKVAGEMAAYIDNGAADEERTGIHHGDLRAWVAALDAILRGEGTT